jgi:16S rRNA (uracil1498-N3)-methyltransferase
MALHFVDAAAGTAREGDTVELTGAEAHHAAAVRRVREGEAVTLTDGRGVWLMGACEEVEPRRVVVRIARREEVPASSPRLALAQALAKGDRDELAAQAATELGVEEIVPWQAARSISRWEGQKAAKGRARWQAIVREAAKQAHRSWIAEVGEVSTTAQLAARAEEERVLVLDPHAETALTALDLSDGRDLVLVVGPEGGITQDELDRLEAAGAERVRLGSTVLRTSTAGPAAIAILSAKLGRW